MPNAILHYVSSTATEKSSFHMDYPSVKLANCVGTASLGAKIDLEEIAWECHAELDRSSFAACLLRSNIGEKTTALVFQ